MLLKLLRAPKSGPDSTSKSKGEKTTLSSAALKIVHAGGIVECYYMAVPAARVIDEYPNFVLARPEIFRRPWDSVVLADEMLLPGEKYFVVPTRTVRKLRRRIRRASAGGFAADDSSAPQEDALSRSASLVRKGIIRTKSKVKARPRNRHVRFLGVDGKEEDEAGDGKKDEKLTKRGGDSSAGFRERKWRGVGGSGTWEPSLNPIDEIHDK